MPSRASLHFDLFSLVLIGLVALASGCGDDDMPADASPDGDAPADARRDIAPDVPPDTDPECNEGDLCDDGIDCTRDFCDPTGRCAHVTDFAMCDDGVFCNGVERCDAERGCVEAPPETCDDMDVCTIDRCDEEEKICRHSPRDLDEDGEADWHCEGGTDCDDRDETRGMNIAEICADGVDNDCDENTDEAECGRPRYDECGEPIDLSTGGRFELSFDGARSDYELGCTGGNRRELVGTFTIEEPQSVTITADGMNVTYLELRTTCDDGDTALECREGFPATLRRRTLEAGTYFLMIASAQVGTVGVNLRFEDPVPPPTNTTCETAQVVEPGGSLMASFVDVESDIEPTCATTPGPDLVYTVTVEETADLVVAAVSESGDNMLVDIRLSCDDADSTVRCTRAAPAITRVHSAAPGDYFIVVEGPGTSEVDFTLNVNLEEPTSAPEADICMSAVPLTFGESQLGSLADKQDDYPTSCGFSYRDAVYSFELTERSDVTVQVDGGGTFMTTAVRRTCTSPDSELRCEAGNPSTARMRNLNPGTYYVIVESFGGGGFNIQVDRDDPSPVTPVEMNNRCAQAFSLPEAGGLFSGSTTGFLNSLTASCGSEARSPEAVFTFELTRNRIITATTSGSGFDTVLYILGTECDSMNERVCDDDGGDGSSSRIERALPPGIYYLIVDGWGDTNSGDYLLEVAFADP